MTRTLNLDRYRIVRGQILQTCSGRNLGPNILVDDYLTGFAASHDLIRIDIDDERLRHYAVAFLRSGTGQDLLRRDKSGSVIDHISVGHVEAMEIPLPADAVIDGSAELVCESFELTERARLALAKALKSYQDRLPSPSRDTPAKLGWSLRAGELKGRLDVAPYDPWLLRLREELIAAGGVPLGEVAEVIKPAGRHKTIYVDKAFGRPYMSGTQILQLALTKRQFMAEHAFREIANYELDAGWSVFMADGRAEKDLGVVAMVPSDRASWLASGHVGRLAPNPRVDQGWLWLAARTWQTQVQIKALAAGSVVDSTYPVDLESVILPPAGGVNGKVITAAWEEFAKARAAEAKAISVVDQALAEISGV
jgi:hypothetical protein